MLYQEQPAASLVEIRRDNVRFPRLHTYPADVAIRCMSAVVLRAAKYFDAEVNMDDVGSTAIDLYSELMADAEGLRTFNLSFEEIGRAIRKAATGQSVEFYGKLSFHFLYKCIMHYVKNDVMEANRKMLQIAESGRGQRYAEQVAKMTSRPARQMLEHSKKQ